MEYDMIYDFVREHKIATFIAGASIFIGWGIFLEKYEGYKKYKQREKMSENPGKSLDKKIREFEGNVLPKNK